ncbi:MAG: squalene synthase HpnC [Rhodospirillaceae bacterium]|nr:squalene synthase HpnC [Rhodospirillaceae bacterium]
MTDTTITTAETPSGKAAKDENFPVGSIFLPADLRPHVAVFYAYARAIDDIADNPDLTPEEKIKRLDGFDQAILGKNTDPAYGKAHAIRMSLSKCDVTIQHCRDLITAFKQDAVKLRYDDWPDLINYCMYSAAPVGRYLLDIHGENPTNYPASDALCNALQVLNHLQDCQDDYQEMNRVYLPQDWMIAANETVDALAQPAASAGLREVMEQCLDSTDELLLLADQLPGKLKSRRLAMESATIIKIAHKLSAELRRRDPISGRVQLTKLQFLTCSIRGCWQGLSRY